MGSTISGAQPSQPPQQIQVGQEGQGSSGGGAKMSETVGLINSAGATYISENLLKNADLDALMLAVMSERAELLEKTLRDQVQEVREKNNKLKEANSVMAKARAAKKGSGEEDKTEMPQDVKDFFAKNDISWGDGGSKIDPSSSYSLNASEWDLAIENMKGWSESLTSSSQLDMTKLQSTSGKSNQTFEMMSQFIAKYFRSGDSVIKNI